LTIPTNASNPAGGAAFVEFLLGTSGRTLLGRAGLDVLDPTVVGDRMAIAPTLRPTLRLTD
jgi:hypothetical protein